MIPQLILLAILGLWIRTSFLSRDQSPQMQSQWQATMIFVCIFLVLLTWGGFFEPILKHIR